MKKITERQHAHKRTVTQRPISLVEGCSDVWKIW